MATGGRKTQLQAMHQISVELGPTSPLAGFVGVVPAGAILGTTHMLIATAFNSTTNTAAVGTTAGGAQLFGATDTKTPARGDVVAATAAAGPFGVDTPIHYTMTQTGPAPTTGRVVIYVDYLPGPG